MELRSFEGGRRGDSILLGVPTFGAVSIEWHGSMMTLQQPMNRSIRHAYVKGKEVGDARNMIVRQALEFRGLLGERISHIFFVDDDVLIPSHALTQLLSHNLPIVSGLYYAKTLTPQPLMLDEAFNGLKTEWTEGDLVPCVAHGMGCTLIETKVFEALGDGPWFKTTNESFINAQGTPVQWHQTEDVFFLKRAKDAGFQPTVDTGLFAFHYSMSEHVGYPLDKWKALTTAKPEAVPA